MTVPEAQLAKAGAADLGPAEADQRASGFSWGPTGTRSTGAASPRHRLLVGLIFLLSLWLNLTGNSWGTPDRWHPDEMDTGAAALVAQKTLNPHFFPYGGLQYYIIAVTAAMPVGAYNFVFDRKPAATDEGALSAWRDRKDARVHVMARAASGVMAALTVLITYYIGVLLFGETTGLLAALFLAVAPYTVLIAHFSTVDTGANFWYWLACLLGVLSWKRAVRPWFALAAFTVGLATGTKVDRLLAVIPWITVGLLQPNPSGVRLRRLLLCAALIPVGYLVANPTLLLSFYEFVDGTVKDLAFNTLRGNGATAFIPLLADMATGMGIAVLVIALASFFYLGVEAIRGQMRREFVWLASAMLPMFLVYGSRLALPWYSTFIFPGLALTAAQGCVSLSHAVKPRLAAATGVAVFAAVVWSLLYCIAVDQQFRHDSRYAAAQWIESAVPHGASIEMSHRGPVLAAGQYDVRHDLIPQDYYTDAREWRTHLGSSGLYSTVHAALLSLHRLTSGPSGSVDTGQGYRAWFDRVIKPAVPEQDATAAAEADYRVLVDYLDGAQLQKLQAADSGYQLAATFHYRHPLGLDVPFPFVNPTVYVFKRVAAPS